MDQHSCLWSYPTFLSAPFPWPSIKHQLLIVIFVTWKTAVSLESRSLGGKSFVSQRMSQKKDWQKARHSLSDMSVLCLFLVTLTAAVPAAALNDPLLTDSCPLLAICCWEVHTRGWEELTVDVLVVILCLKLKFKVWCFLLFFKRILLFLFFSFSFFLLLLLWVFKVPRI